MHNRTYGKEEFQSEAPNCPEDCRWLHCGLLGMMMEITNNRTQELTEAQIIE